MKNGEDEGHKGKKNGADEGHKGKEERGLIVELLISKALC